jgi:uncharacterized protein DUF4326
MPEGAVYVGRPTIWGNPFAVTRSSDFHGLPGSWFVRGEDGSVHHPVHDTQTSARRRAVELYALELLRGSSLRISVEMVRAELAGRPLACWCPRSEPCHADVLLTIANSPAVDVTAASAHPTTTQLLAGANGCPDCAAGTDRAALDQLPRDRTTAATPAPLRCPTCGYGYDSAAV